MNIFELIESGNLDAIAQHLNDFPDDIIAIKEGYPGNNLRLLEYALQYQKNPQVFGFLYSFYKKRQQALSEKSDPESAAAIAKSYPNLKPDFFKALTEFSWSSTAQSVINTSLQFFAATGIPKSDALYDALIFSIVSSILEKYGMDEKEKISAIQKLLQEGRGFVVEGIPLLIKIMEPYDFLLSESAKLELIDILCKEHKDKVDLNFSRDKIDCPLLITTDKGQFNILQKLLELGADIQKPTNEWDNIFSKFLKSLKMQSAFPKQPLEAILDFYIEKFGINCQFPPYDQTPLFLALSSGNIALIQKLLAKGADVRVKDKYDRPLLIEAIERAKLFKEEDYLPFLEMLCKQVDVNITDRNGNTPLHVAVKSGNIKIVELLLRHKADVQATTNNGLTALDNIPFINHEYDEYSLTRNTMQDCERKQKVEDKEIAAHIKKLLINAGAVEYLGYSGLLHATEAFITDFNKDAAAGLQQHQERDKKEKAQAIKLDACIQDKAPIDAIKLKTMRTQKEILWSLEQRQSMVTLRQLQRCPMTSVSLKCSKPENADAGSDRPLTAGPGIDKTSAVDPGKDRAENDRIMGEIPALKVYDWTQAQDYRFMVHTTSTLPAELAKTLNAVVSDDPKFFIKTTPYFSCSYIDKATPPAYMHHQMQILFPITFILDINGSAVIKAFPSDVGSPYGGVDEKSRKEYIKILNVINEDCNKLDYFSCQVQQGIENACVESKHDAEKPMIDMSRLDAIMKHSKHYISCRYGYPGHIPYLTPRQLLCNTDHGNYNEVIVSGHSKNRVVGILIEKKWLEAFLETLPKFNQETHQMAIKSFQSLLDFQQKNPQFPLILVDSQIKPHQKWALPERISHLQKEYSSYAANFAELLLYQFRLKSVPKKTEAQSKKLEHVNKGIQNDSVNLLNVQQELQEIRALLKSGK